MSGKTNEQIAEARDIAESIESWLNSLPPYERNGGDKDFDRRTLASLRAVADALEAANRLVDKSTDEQVERAARALNREGWTCSGGGDEPGNYDECDDCKRVCDDMARAALAAVGIAPQAPSVTYEGLRVAMLGTTDGDFINPDSAIPAGEMFRLAAEYLGAGAPVAPPTFDVDKIAEVIRHELIGAVGNCACHEAYTSRKRRDPDCEWHCVSPRDDFRMEVAQAVVAHLRGESK